MNRLNNSEITRIVIVVLILLLLLGGFLFLKLRSITRREAGNNISLSPTVTAQVENLDNNRMYFKPAKKEVSQGKEFEMVIYLRADKKTLFGADAVITYDPEYLDVVEIKEADIFKSYPKKKADAEKKLIKISGYTPANDRPLSGEQLFATLKLKAKKAGKTKLTFDFQKGRTNRSTLVEAGTSRNVLGAVLEAYIDIK